jgi:transcription initiation factor TFIIB
MCNSYSQVPSKALGSISALCERLGLKDNVKHRAQEIFAQVWDMKDAVGRRSPTAVHSSCIFIACREERVERSFNEIAQAANVEKKLVGRCFKAVMKVVDVDRREMASQNYISHVSRYCCALGMENEVNVVSEMLRRAMNSEKPESEAMPWDARSPTSITAAVIYMVSRLGGTGDIGLAEVSKVCLVAEITIKRAYKDLMKGGARTLVPDWFASDAAVANLPCL